jgi:hypothetical protein
MINRITKLLSLFACIFALGSAANAQPLHPVNPYDSQAATIPVTFEAIDNSGLFWNKEVAACDDAAVLNRIRNGFHHQVLNVPRLPDVEILNFRKIHQHRYIPGNDVSNTSRRYCGATADFSDGRSRPVYYLIRDEMGFASVGDGVQFCVPGFDRWRAYNGYCRLID